MSLVNLVENVHSLELGIHFYILKEKVYYFIFGSTFFWRSQKSIEHFKRFSQMFVEDEPVPLRLFSIVYLRS